MAAANPKNAAVIWIIIFCSPMRHLITEWDGICNAIYITTVVSLIRTKLKSKVLAKILTLVTCWIAAM